ncbi:MAG: alpha/beta fold hydrolase [Deltaproteobacteria bacterium]|nr:alpha/beta fold hydrolase [Deltaproteobacteria bacterium]
MKKPGVIAAVVAMVGAALIFFHLPWEEAPSGLQRSRPEVLTGEQVIVRWHDKAPFRKRRGVALVLHGLNLQPEKMESVISLLNRAGIDALNVSLRGHGENYLHRTDKDPEETRLDSFRTVTYPLWYSEVRRSYLKVRERARQKKTCVFLIGYSLGGLLGCDLLISDPVVRFDRMVLLAPALNVTVESYLLKALMPFPGIVIDSLSPASYRSNDGTPMAGYKALFEALDHFKRHLNPALNVPTLVLMDREDEFISHDAIREMIGSRRLNLWKMTTVRKMPHPDYPYARHLIIDEASMGKTAWREMGEAILGHLVPSAQGRASAPFSK